MLVNFSENEREFLKKILSDYDIRADGRDRLSLRSLELKPDSIPSCFGSLKIKLVDSNKEILFAIKADLLKAQSQTAHENLDFFSISLDSMNKIEDLKLKSEIEDYIRNLILAKINKEIFFVKNDNNEITEYYWRLYIDVFIFDSVKITYLQLISLGVKQALLNLKLPKLIFFKNEISGISEFDLIENYQDVSEADKEVNLAFAAIPDILVFSLINNVLYLDPSDEEEAISNSIIIASKVGKNLESIQSIGSVVDLNRIFDITDIIKNFSL
jgi:exosome complex RNA-binding protein Rrp42 (RNase PH superfamily)